VLDNVSRKIRECYAHVEDLGEDRAASETDMAGDNEPTLGEAIIAWIESECRCRALASLLATRLRLTPGRSWTNTAAPASIAARNTQQTKVSIDMPSFSDQELDLVSELADRFWFERRLQNLAAGAGSH
jgi:hypothetical protein